jgi:hypothetical protein
MTANSAGRYSLLKVTAARVKGFTMHRALAASVCLLVLGSMTTLAHGEPGRGLGRALSQAGKNISAPGLNKAGSNLSRAGSKLGRAGGLDRSGALARGPLAKLPKNQPATDTAIADAAKDPALRHQKQLQIEQRNRDHRLAQAAKLRALAEKNGDAELAANADRMEQAALDHYQQRVEHLGRFGVEDLSLNPPQGDVVVEPAPSTPELDINVETPLVEETTAPRAARNGKPRIFGTR